MRLDGRNHRPSTGGVLALVLVSALALFCLLAWLTPVDPETGETVLRLSRILSRGQLIAVKLAVPVVLIGFGLYALGRFFTKITTE